MGEVIRFLFGSVTAFSFEQTVVCSVHFLKRTCVHITGLFFTSLPLILSAIKVCFVDVYQLY